LDNWESKSGIGTRKPVSVRRVLFTQLARTGPTALNENVGFLDKVCQADERRPHFERILHEHSAVE
jgi:hypothetical protein